MQRAVELDDAAVRLAGGPTVEARHGLLGLWEGARSAPLPGDPVWVWDEVAEVRGIALKTLQVRVAPGPPGRPSIPHIQAPQLFSLQVRGIGPPGWSPGVACVAAVQACQPPHPHTAPWQPRAGAGRAKHTNTNTSSTSSSAGDGGGQERAPEYDDDCAAHLSRLHVRTAVAAAQQGVMQVGLGLGQRSAICMGSACLRRLL